jgi:transcriptional regulator with XRE-family HTH domain
VHSNPRTDKPDQLRELIEGTRTARGWSKAQLAKRSELPVTTLYSILDRHRRHYSVRQSTLDKLAAGLELPVTTLMMALGGMMDGDAALIRLLEVWRELNTTGRVRVLELAEQQRVLQKHERPSPATDEGLSVNGD